MLTLSNTSSPTELTTGHRHLQHHLEAIAIAPMRALSNTVIHSTAKLHGHLAVLQVEDRIFICRLRE